MPMEMAGIAFAMLAAGLLLGVFLGRRKTERTAEQPELSVATVFSGQADEALQKRNAIFAKVFNLVPDTLTITRLSDGCYVEVSHNWEALTGFSREEGLGHTSAELGVWVEPQQRVDLIGTLRRDGVVHDFDATFRHKQGHLLYSKVAGSLFESEGETYMMLAVKDVSAQRAAEQEIREINQQLEERVQRRTLKLEQTNAELAQALETLRHAQDELVRSGKMAALGSLVAGVAHELNTPIGNGLTVATTLEHRLQVFEGQVRAGLRRSDLERFMADAQFATEVLVRNLMRAGDLVRSFKQVAVDRASSQRRQFNLQDVVSEIAITLSPVISRSGCEVQADIASGLELDSYPGPLGQVLDNLINNAMTHAFVNGQRGLIEVRARDINADEVQIEVRDNGVGIPADNLKRVFDPFFTTRLGQGGSGLGLHIVHNIVTGVLGGHVDVSSQPGAGTVFTLRVPRRAPESVQTTV